MDLPKRRFGVHSMTRFFLEEGGAVSRRLTVESATSSDSDDAERPRGLHRPVYGIRIFGVPAARFEVLDRGHPISVSIADVSRIEADDDYLSIHVDSRRHMVYMRLRDMLGCLPPERFVQVHRATVVNLEHVRSVVRFPGRRVAFLLTDGTVVVSSRRLALGLRHLL